MNRLLLVLLTAGLLSSCANRQYGSRFEAERACTSWKLTGPSKTSYDVRLKMEITKFDRTCRDEEETKRFIGMTKQKGNIYGGKVVRRFLY